MRKRMPSTLSGRAGGYVPRMAYVGNMEGENIIAADLGTPNAASATALMNSQTVTDAASLQIDSSIQTQSEKVMGRFGRAVTVALSAAGTGTLTVVGRDYLGQRMVETLALNGTTAVNGKKAFRYVDNVTWPAVGSQVTLNLGTTNILGLPYKMLSVTTEIKNGELTANAGTFTKGELDSVAQTATSADPRGTYTPATVLPNGTNGFGLRYTVSTVNAHGNKHFAG
jgi:hypothetical protein